MSNINQLKSIPEISFIDNKTIEDVQNEMITDFTSKYKELTGQELSLSLADPSRLILNACALQIYQCLKCIDTAGKYNLLKYAEGDYLDNIAAFKGIQRLSPEAAKTTIRFSLANVMSKIISIPIGTRVTGNSNKFFSTNEYAEIPIGSIYVDVEATCETTGEEGNDIAIGQLNVLVDSVPYISTVSNTTITSGGSDKEDDDSLTERAYLAPSGYSSAGPEDAYRYFVKNYSTQIGDIKIDSPDPGEVDIYVLMEDGSLPTQTIISGLTSYLKEENIIPMCDLVTVKAPEETEYTINIKYYINNSDLGQATNIKIAVEAAVEQYKTWQRKIGRDINPSKLISLVVEAGAKRVEVTNPINTTMQSNKVAKVTTTSINYGGIEDD